MIDLQLFEAILSVDSTSGQEGAVTELLKQRLDAPLVEAYPVGDGTENLLLSWGTPKVVFCTHVDTVPPYIGPSFEGDVVYGRGSCDAKGQLVSLYSACKELEGEGLEGFGLLLLTGEETGSFGAKAFARTPFRAPYLIVGEPTENKMVSASKGTKSYEMLFEGQAFHSGYPRFGRSAVRMFVDFMNELDAAGFPADPILGDTTWNVGLLSSQNPQNILSPRAECRLYFRTTFASDAAVVEFMSRPRPGITVGPRGGDTPSEYMTLPGFASEPASFGTDAPHLSNFAHKAICGPGSIRHAHRSDEQVLIADMVAASDMYVKMFKQLMSK